MAHIGKGQDAVVAWLKKDVVLAKKVQRPGLCMLIDTIDPYTL